MDMMINKVIMFAIIIAVSFTATKVGWLGENVRDGLSRFIIKVTAPLMIFSSIAGLEFKKSLLFEAGIILVMSFAIVFALILLGRLYVKKSNLGEKTRGVQVALMTFGNVAFIAYPLFEAVFGAVGVFYGAFYHLANDTTFWVLGVSEIEGQKGTKPVGMRLKNVMNPNSAAIALGVICFLFQVKFPPVIYDPLVGLGKTTVYLSLAFVGTAMAWVDLRNTLKKASIYAIVLVKMILAPAAAALILTKVFSFGLTVTAISAVVLQISMPCMILVSIMANELERDYKYASEAVLPQR
ncbi:MAG: Membrane transport protein [Firmicutes bacterium ADurb.Bin193]|nr:MAG: Membrane transport protein [Firmicutes bacterium ADurb.Bin193]